MNLTEIERHFEKNFTHRDELGASVSVWKNGKEVLSLADGWCEREGKKPWTAETLVPFYSVTKGLASATLLLLLEENGITPEDVICDLWKSFPIKNGTYGELMSHRLGLAALDMPASIWNHEEVIAAIENQKPNWSLTGADSGHGYHPRTLGFFYDEIALRLTGKKIGSLWREKIADPLELDAWIGLPESEFSRVASLYVGRQEKNNTENAFSREMSKEASLVRRAFFSPQGLYSVREMNNPRAWQAGLPAIGGVGNACAVAKFYQAACGSIPHFSNKVREWMGTRLCNGEDKILLTPTAFSCGFQLDPLDDSGKKIRQHYGSSKRAFGHPGAGGSHAFGDPGSGVSFAYVMNHYVPGISPGEKCLGLIKGI